MITAIKFSGIDLTRNLIEVCKTWTNGKTYHASGFTHKFVSVPFRKQQVHFQLGKITLKFYGRISMKRNN